MKSSAEFQIQPLLYLWLFIGSNRFPQNKRRRQVLNAPLSHFYCFVCSSELAPQGQHPVSGITSLLQKRNVIAHQIHFFHGNSVQQSKEAFSSGWFIIEITAWSSSPAAQWGFGDNYLWRGGQSRENKMLLLLPRCYLTLWILFAFLNFIKADQWVEHGQRSFVWSNYCTLNDTHVSIR